MVMITATQRSKACECDKCKYTWVISEISENEMTLGVRPVKVIGFTCPRCQQFYLITIKSDETEEIVRNLERCKILGKSRFPVHSSEQEQQEYLRKVNKEVEYWQRKYKTAQSRLKKLYLKEVKRQHGTSRNITIC